LETIRAEMAAYTEDKPLVALARHVGLSQSICWRILNEPKREASLHNVEKLLSFFGYRLVKDESADRSRKRQRSNGAPKRRRKV
jgi:hypothetical protein